MEVLKAFLIILCLLFPDLFWIVPLFYLEQRKKLAKIVKKNPSAKPLLTLLQLLRAQISWDPTLKANRISALDAKIEYLQHKVADGSDIRTSWITICEELQAQRYRRIRSKIDVILNGGSQIETQAE